MPIIFRVYFKYMRPIIITVYFRYIYIIMLCCFLCLRAIYLMMQPMSVVCSCQPQQWQDGSQQGLGLAAAWTDAFHFEGSYHCTDWWLEDGPEDTSIPLVRAYPGTTGKRQVLTFTWAHSFYNLLNTNYI